MNLIIVESPTKAKTFRYLIDDQSFEIIATLGHIRDLPENSLSIDYKKNFLPKFKLIKNKKKIVDLIKRAYKKNKMIIFATDPDREGESISYHVAYLLGFIEKEWPEIILKKNQLKRIIFHEITKEAIKEALANPQSLRLSLVKAQMTRRILDRIVGYELSPILWKKTGKNWLSAGRVQTIALRLIVEREKEIQRFSKEKYYQIKAEFTNLKYNLIITARLVSIKDKPIEIKQKIDLFDGFYQYTKTTIGDQEKEKILTDLKKDTFVITNIEEKEVNKYPPPPFTTSLLQQQAFNQLGFSSRLTMKLAQDLYENGLITYHRTDSFNLSTAFLFKAKDYLIKKYGEKYALQKPRNYQTRSKLAQEAHEAIRPTILEPSPKKLKNLTRPHHRLYDLIFRRALSTQMAPAIIKEQVITIKSQSDYWFQSDSQTVIFDGFLRILNPRLSEKNNNQNSNAIKELINQEINLKDLFAEEKETQTPPRYTEASLIKSLEEKGIGRPSTYAMIITLISQRNYVEKYGRVFRPTFIGTKISDFLVQQFPNLFNLQFTALMEDDLDEIANGNKNHLEVLNLFYQELIKKKEKINYDDNLHLEEITEERCPQCQSHLVIRYSRYGKFLACSRYPQCKYTKKIQYYVKEVNCPKCNGRLVIKFSKNRKKFYGCENYPKCDFSAWKLPKKI